MKIFIAIIIFTLTSFVGKRENLDYPKKIEEIEKITLTRPYAKSKGKIATVKDLTKDQTKNLLDVLDNAKAIGPVKFKTDNYIVFTTKTNETNGIKIAGNKIKGYDSDFSYKIESLEFLAEF